MPQNTPSVSTAASFVKKMQARGKPANRLLHEQSPYLQLHAFQEIDWYPWGAEALARAKLEGKPIFLSIGYSTCHWCHVMARGAFSHPAIAAYLNEHFIAIKVDREERPDIDRLYMEATRAMTGGGGWPLSVFLTPELKPFYAGTYYPPEAEGGLPGFGDVLRAVHTSWTTDRENVQRSSERVAAFLKKEEPEEVAKRSAQETVRHAFSRLSARYDAVNGGFGGSPKFPQPTALGFLLRYGKKNQDAQAVRMALSTLRHMAFGGIYDQIGGGFHRYATDANWFVPHFEKMLYDQGQLAMAYLEAHQLTGDDLFARIGKETLEFVHARMQHRHGGFYSAFDADSPDPEAPDHHGEGLYYLWRESELVRLLGGKAEVVAACFGVRPEWNVRHDPMGEFRGRNILFRAETTQKLAVRFSMAEKDVVEQVAWGRRKMGQQRDLRPPPRLDDKIIVSWNGLMISAFATGFRVLGEPRFRDAAVNAADFILATMYDAEKKELLRRFRDGRAGVEAGLEDYAFLTQGLLDLYEATFDAAYLAAAETLTRRQIELFTHPRGGFYDTSGRDDTVLFRTRSTYDGAEPTGNSVAAMNLLRLGWMLDRKPWRGLAEKTVGSFAATLSSAPDGMLKMVAVRAFLQGKPRQLVLVGRKNTPAFDSIKQAAQKNFLPHTVFLHVPDGNKATELTFLPASVRGYVPVDNRPTAYICKNYVCSLPLTDPAAVEQALR